MIFNNKGVNIYYELEGNGFPFVFINSFAFNHSSYLQLRDYYKNKYKILLFDNIGCGQSDSPDFPYTIESMAEDLNFLLGYLNIDKAIIFGHSMGGAIAQTFALKYSNKVKALILSNTFMKLDIRFSLAIQAQLESLERGITSKSLGMDILGWVFSSEFLNRPGILDILLEARKNDPYPTSSIGYKHQMEALLSFDSRNWISSIESQSLIIGSKEDMIIPNKDQDLLGYNLINSEHFYFINTGHVPFVEHPETFKLVIDDFLKII